MARPSRTARLHLERIGVKLARLTRQQTGCLGELVEGPSKPEHYRYKTW